MGLKRWHPTLGRRAQSPVKKTPFCSWPIWANPLEVSPEPDKLKLPSSFCIETEMVARFEIMKSPPKPFVGSLRSEMRLATPLHWSWADMVAGNGVFGTSAPLDRLLRRVIQSFTATLLNCSEAVPLPK